MSILDGVAEALFDAFRDDPATRWYPASITRTTATNGGPYSEGEVRTSTQDCLCIVAEYTSFMRGHLGVPDDAVNLLVLQINDAAEWVDVQVADTIMARGIEWRLTRVSQDPARATWDCEARPNG